MEYVLKKSPHNIVFLVEHEHSYGETTTTKQNHETYNTPTTTHNIEHSKATTDN